tara:strand:+ start:343 stop:996 length:654 start_codon:yes stop_codon:yes gene_type:complete
MGSILEDGLSALGGLFSNNDGTTNFSNIAKIGGAILGGTGAIGTSTPPSGYQGTVPKYDVQRDVVPGTYDPNRRPGSGGQRYFTQTQFMPRAAEPVTPMSAEGLATLNAANPAREEVQQPVQQMAAGGIATLNKGKYLDGASDGMADKVPANIDGVQEARLSDGEFVIPADVVSHLGNGNSDAGAKVLKGMMSRVRKARTGNDKQGKEIDPNKFIPA